MSRQGGSGGADEQTDRPALCAAHRGLALPALTAAVVVAPRGRGLYGDFFSDREIALLEALANERSLEGEAGLVRVILMRLMLDSNGEGGWSA